ncbi:MAG: hypothetical protein WC713_04265 [Candidatus Methylomirabilota bacterium]
MSDDYYNFRVNMMDTDTGFHEARQFDRRAVFVPDGKGGARWWAMDGFWLGNDLDDHDLKAIERESGAAASNCIQAEVEDNGHHGDGLWLSFAPIVRYGSHETHTDRWHGEHEPAGLFGIRLTPAQARVLGGALIAAATVADAQEGRLDSETDRQRAGEG